MKEPYKLTASQVQRRFFGAPEWWIPADGTSRGSQIWNCRRYSAFLRDQGLIILESGERKGSPWWLVIEPEEVKASGPGVP